MWGMPFGKAKALWRERIRDPMGFPMQSPPSAMIVSLAVCAVLAQATAACSCSDRKPNPRDTSVEITEVPKGAEFYLGDIQGSPVTTLSAKGAVTSTTAYHPYGAARRATGASGDPFGFVGNEEDRGSGISDFRARAYRPELDVFLAVDPVALFEPEKTLKEPRLLSAYGYGASDPITLSDKDGRYAQITRQGNAITIVMPMLWRKGDGVSDKQFEAKVAEFTKGVEATWSGKFGKYEVKTVVQRLSEAEAREIGEQGRGLNVLTVEGEARSANVNPGRVSVWRRNDLRDNAIPGASEEGSGYLMADADGKTGAHEAGHLLGLTHESGENSKVVNGRERVYDPSNIMTKPGPGTAVTAGQIADVASRCNYGCSKP
jgi:RHS repeat-associated protein